MSIVLAIFDSSFYAVDAKTTVVPEHETGVLTDVSVVAGDRLILMFEKDAYIQVRCRLSPSVETACNNLHIVMHHVEHHVKDLPKSCEIWLEATSVSSGVGHTEAVVECRADRGTRFCSLAIHGPSSF